MRGIRLYLSQRCLASLHQVAGLMWECWQGEGAVAWIARKLVLVRLMMMAWIIELNQGAVAVMGSTVDSWVRLRKAFGACLEVNKAG